MLGVETTIAKDTPSKAANEKKIKAAVAAMSQ